MYPHPNTHTPISSFFYPFACQRISGIYNIHTFIFNAYHENIHFYHQHLTFATLFRWKCNEFFKLKMIVFFSAYKSVGNNHTIVIAQKYYIAHNSLKFIFFLSVYLLTFNKATHIGDNPKISSNYTAFQRLRS